MNKKVGNFEGSVDEPWPCNCVIIKHGCELRFNHQELSDLEYLIKRMKKAAKEKLGKYKNEV